MITLLPETTITTAVTGSTTDAVKVDPGTCHLGFLAKFDYGSGGTSAKFWIQTSVDGTTWTDVANFAFATADLNKVAAVNIFVAHTHATPSDAALSDNSIANGYIGEYLRVKYTTVGTYGGSTTITITAVPKSLTMRKAPLAQP